MTDDDDPIVCLSPEELESKQHEKNNELRAALEQAGHTQRPDNRHLNKLQSIFNMDRKEATAFVRKCDSAMKSHASDFQRGHDKDAALSAFESVMATLLEIRPAYPAEHANIDEVLRRHGYSVMEN